MADTSELMLRLEKIKRIDMRVAVDVAGIANMQVRDVNGNLLPLVWTRQSVNNEFENATLLTRDALQKHLQTFIDAGVKENIDILQKVEDPALLVDWVVRTAEYWERRYATKRDEKYDISQTVFSAMFEAVSTDIVKLSMEERGFVKFEQTLADKLLALASAQQSKKNKYHLLLLKYVTDVESPSANSELESFFWMHRGFTAYVRLLFRLDVIPNLREQLCLLAGKLVQKKEVCNKAGAYSSMRQRSDVMQEFSRQKRFFASFIYSIPQESIERMHQLLEVDNWIFYSIDHTALPVTLSHMHAPPVSVPQALTPACPRCCASLEHEEPKRRRTD